MTFAKILITAVALVYAIVAPLALFNETHAVHPDWSAHARHHLVWFQTTGSMLGLLAVWLVWRQSGGAVIGGAITVCVLGGFLISAVTLPLYGGSLADDAGDGAVLNVAVNGALFVLNAVGIWLALGHRAEVADHG